jgi:hypothetical protein
MAKNAKPKLIQVKPTTEEDDVSPIIKPNEFSLKDFEASSDATLGGVGTELAALPHYPISHASDYVRLHPDMKYWSAPLCFVNVPIKGEKSDTLHLISEELTKRLLSSGRIKRWRLALATKPHDIFFLCQVPSTNLDNDWNKSNLAGCEKAKTLWTQVISRKKEGIESYKLEFAHDQDAFPPPNWPTQPLNELIFKAFAPHCMITDENHPGLLRLLGKKQNLS